MTIHIGFNMEKAPVTRRGNATPLIDHQQRPVFGPAVGTSRRTGRQDPDVGCSANPERTIWASSTAVGNSPARFHAYLSPPTGSMWGRMPHTAAWTGSTKLGIKPSKISFSILRCTTLAHCYVDISQSKQTACAVTCTQPLFCKTYSIASRVVANR